MEGDDDESGREASQNGTGFVEAPVADFAVYLASLTSSGAEESDSA